MIRTYGKKTFHRTVRRVVASDWDQNSDNELDFPITKTTVSKSDIWKSRIIDSDEDSNEECKENCVQKVNSTEDKENAKQESINSETKYCGSSNQKHDSLRYSMASESLSNGTDFPAITDVVQLGSKPQDAIHETITSSSRAISTSVDEIKPPIPILPDVVDSDNEKNNIPLPPVEKDDVFDIINSVPIQSKLSVHIAPEARSHQVNNTSRIDTGYRKSNESLSKLLSYTKTGCIVPWSEFLSECVGLSKIGEATYSEVFKASTLSKDCNIIIKIIPFGDAPVIVNGSEQQRANEVLQEVTMTYKLHKLSIKPLNFHFVGFKGCYVCKGEYPQELVDIWDEWDAHKTSENDRPDFFKAEQLFCIILLTDGGNDLEHSKGKLTTWDQVQNIIVQLALSLSAAEKFYRFEHRDLHWGNVLITECTDQEPFIYSINRKLAAKVSNCGLRLTIIDFTLSRLEAKGQVNYIQLDDESIFTGEGDYQYDIYRMMKSETMDDWAGFYPKTNIMWVHYLTDKILLPKYVPISRTKEAREQKIEFLAFKDRILQYNNSIQLVADPFIKSKIMFYQPNFESIDDLTTKLKTTSID